MRKLFKSFPEILLIDGTYNVNGQGMPLYCLMAEDGYGHGWVVYYAATTGEGALHLQKIMQSFKEENSSWSSVRGIIIDKDFTEWRILKNKSFRMQQYYHLLHQTLSVLGLACTKHLSNSLASSRSHLSTPHSTTLLNKIFITCH